MLKRTFDITASLVGLICLGWLLLLLYLTISAQFKSDGIFRQPRIGRFGRTFTIYKFRTMHPITGNISTFSKFLRDSKLDEMPQLVNVLKGDMSFVGPRPDIPGYYDMLQGEDRKILELRPGITSPASIKYKGEEAMLAAQQHPLAYNDEVIFPDKVRLNLDYYYNRTFLGDLKIIIRTIVGK